MTRRSTGAERGEAEPGILTRRAFVGAAGGGIVLLAGGSGALGYALARVNRIGSFREEALAELREGERPMLLRRSSRLASALPWRPIGTFPTPIEALPTPPGADGVDLYVKRDDLASPLYGGNKVRKLEHFLAEAELGGHRTLVTLGGLGTNHGLATALHGRALGFETELVLYDQPMTPLVRRTHERLRASGARLHRAGSETSAFVRAHRVLDRIESRGGAPYFINVGGTSRLGTLGFVSAALELADQVAAGAMPPPDDIFVALGTCGTAAGLLAGLRLAGLPTRLHAVRVTGFVPANRFVVRHLADDAQRWMAGVDPALESRAAPVELRVHGAYRGPGYGVPTPDAERAMEWAAPRLRLEPTYTGKALAACLDYCGRSGTRGTVLFWNTYDSALADRANRGAFLATW